MYYQHIVVLQILWVDLAIDHINFSARLFKVFLKHLHTFITQVKGYSIYTKYVFA